MELEFGMRVSESLEVNRFRLLGACVSKADPSPVFLVRSSSRNSNSRRMRSQAIKNYQIPLLKEAKTQTIIAYFCYTKLIIIDRKTENGVAKWKQQHPPVDVAAVENSRTDSEVGARTEDSSRTVAGVIDGDRQIWTWGQEHRGRGCCRGAWAVNE